MVHAPHPIAPIRAAWRRPLATALTLGLVLLGTPARAQQRPALDRDRSLHADRIIIRRPPVIILPYPLPAPEREQVRVEFDAGGSDWGAVYLDGRPIYRPQNFNRQHTLYLPPGGYRLEITGVVRADRWASGFLDLGRDSSRVVVVRFSKTEGVTVSGSPYVWIPDRPR